MRVRINGARLFFDVEGVGLIPDGAAMRTRPTVVLIHGGPGADHSLFKPVMSPLSDTAQLIYVDLLGCGRSDRGDPQDWQWDRWADDVASLCAELDIAGPVLLGTSGGAWVALTCAIRHPATVAGLVLDSCMPATHEQTIAVFERTGGTVAANVARRFFAGEQTDEIRTLWNQHCLPLYSRRAKSLNSDVMSRVIWNPEVEDQLRLGAMRAFDPWNELDQVQCPTLVLAGADDPATPADEAARLVEAMTACEVSLVRFENCGHGVFRELGDEAIKPVRRFLQDMA